MLTPTPTSRRALLLDRGHVVVSRAHPGVAGPDPRFTADPAAVDGDAVAHDGVRKLAGLQFTAILFGHGEPVTSRGSERVADLASTL